MKDIAYFLSIIGLLIFCCWNSNAITRIRMGTDNIAALTILNRMALDRCGDANDGFLVCYHEINDRIKKVEEGIIDHNNRILGLKETVALNYHLNTGEIEDLRLKKLDKSLLNKMIIQSLRNMNIICR